MESDFTFGVGFGVGLHFGVVFFNLESVFISTLKLEADIRGIYLFKGILLMSIKKNLESFKNRASLAIN